MTALQLKSKPVFSQAMKIGLHENEFVDKDNV